MNKFSLDKQPKIKSGFTVPDDYFEQFPRIILEKIEQQKDKKPAIFTVNRFMFAAAAILIVALSIPFLLDNSIASLDEIDTLSLENYIADQSTISSYELINLLEIQELDAINIEMNLEDEAMENALITNPNFENYILE